MYRQSIQFPAKDAALRDDVHALGELIGETLRDQGGDEFFKLVEGDRQAAILRREGMLAAAGSRLNCRFAPRGARRRPPRT
jgi:phosphoenolpyruvate carboxylase